MPASGKRVQKQKDTKIDARAYVEDGAELGDNVKIGPFTHVFSSSIMEKNCIIEGHCVIGHPSKVQLQGTDFSAASSKVTEFLVKEPITSIGEGSIIRAGSTIYNHVRIGKKLRTGHNVLIREHVTMGNDCIVGTHAILDGYIKVGNKSMIQSQCYITQSVRIGNGVFIAPGCIFLDNKKMILGEGLSGIVVEDFARIGGGSKILPSITIGQHALIGAGSVVTKNIPKNAVVFGVPAKVKRFQTKKEIKEYANSILGWNY